MSVQDFHRGKPEALLPIALTDDADTARTKIAKALTVYGQLPSFRAMLEREGIKGPAELAAVGDKAGFRDDLDRRRDAGATDFKVAIAEVADGAFGRTIEFLATP